MALCKNNLALVETEKTTDCDVVVDRLEDTLYDFGDCFDAVLNRIFPTNTPRKPL
jgi:hypothetical protein